MPEGVPFKKPSCYGVKQISEIMKCHQTIAFDLTDEDCTDGVYADSTHAVSTHADGTLVAGIDTSLDAFKILGKVVEEEKIPGVVGGREFIEESDLEVKELELSEDEFQLLVTKFQQYFTNDALSSLHANYESYCNHEGYILPVYTEAEEPYWLFYHPGKKTELENLQPHDKLWGYWLNTTQKLNYELLANEKASVNGISIIKYSNEQHSSMYLSLRRSLELENKTTILISESFHENVVACLKKNGFL